MIHESADPRKADAGDCSAPAPPREPREDASAPVAAGVASARPSGPSRKAQLAALSRDFVDSSRAIAQESDRWILQVLGRTDQGARRVTGVIGRCLTTGPSRLWARCVPVKNPRERLRRVILAEARRVRCDVQQSGFEAFSERMAALLDLVFSGAIGVEDIAFEAEAEAEAATEATAAAPVDGDAARADEAYPVSGSPRRSVPSPPAQ